MNTPILLANILTLLAFFIHTFMGDNAVRKLEPTEVTDGNFKKREVWTMVRGAWHWISVDLLFATIGLALINFTNFFDNKTILLKILSVYFLGYAVVWIFIIAISKQFPKNYLKLIHWVLFLAISGLIYWGTI
jgi:hypothetical protein